MDWMLDNKLNDLFTKFSSILVSLSGDEDIRKVLIKKCSENIFKLFSFYIFLGKTKEIIELFKVLRNLSFENENNEIFKIIQRS